MQTSLKLKVTNLIRFYYDTKISWDYIWETPDRCLNPTTIEIKVYLPLFQNNEIQFRFQIMWKWKK
jgi:hypothetical protein